MKNHKTSFTKTSVLLCAFLMLLSTPLLAQNISVKGTVTDKVTQETLLGVTILVKGTDIGTVTDFDGNYTLSSIPSNAVLVVSFVGMETAEVPVAGKSTLNMQLGSSAVSMDEVVIVGYGVQKKESVVGAISQTKGEELLKSGGVTNVGEALQGKMPGVTAIMSNGQPGEGEPQIFIRGQSSWNGGGQPLILVDGVERPMGDIDMSEIENISILKDASATAVFGVKGGNGVILITTKRGEKGKAKLSLSGNATAKFVSKLLDILPSDEAAYHANQSILREMLYQPSWGDYTSQRELDIYRNPANDEERAAYPNEDWSDVLLKDYAMDYRANLSVRGGSDFAKYFSSVSFQSVSDMFKSDEYDNGKDYESGFSYNRVNFRANLDFDITKTTTFSVNLSGLYGRQKQPRVFGKDNIQITGITRGIYSFSPALYYAQYEDGAYGKSDYALSEYGYKNPLVQLTSVGVNYTNKIQMTSDFSIHQKLDFITPGLNFKGSFSFDNRMKSIRRINDYGGTLENVWFREPDGNLISGVGGVNDFSYQTLPWTLDDWSVQNNTRMRRLNYEFSFNYNRQFEKHDVSGLFLMKREEYAIGNMFPRYREDWVTRLTYNYDSRYFFDINGAYNGSEKFGPEYRFEVFPSVAAGWMISNENYFKKFSWLDKLKIRGSYGKVGDDNAGGRWEYVSQWASSDNQGALISSSKTYKRSPYDYYTELAIANEDLHWETSIKSNLGFEFSALRGLFTFDIDWFTEQREDIIIAGEDRLIPDFMGASNSLPSYNEGEVKVNGYELSAGINHTFGNDLRLWTTFTFSRATDEIIVKNDPELLPGFQKSAGYPIGQPHAAIPGEIMETWDDVYMSTPLSTGQEFKRVGYYDVMDFNFDGSYESAKDNAPYGYPVRPQNNWSINLGTSYKGFSFMVQFYGTQNATRVFNVGNFDRSELIFLGSTEDYWEVDNTSSSYTLSPYSLKLGAMDPLMSMYDASVTRLKTMELAYNIPSRVCEKLKVSDLRLFINGNNLFLWTKLPDDREFSRQGASSQGDYPTAKRVNIGFNLNF